MASAGGAALADTAALGQAGSASPSTASRADAPMAMLIRALEGGLSSALGAIVAAATPQSALPPKRISAKDRRAAAPTRPAPVRKPTHHDIASMPAASAGTNGSFQPPSAKALQKASATSVAQVTHTPPDHVSVMLGSIAVAPTSAPPRVVNA